MVSFYQGSMSIMEQSNNKINTVTTHLCYVIVEIIVKKGSADENGNLCELPIV